MSEVTCKERHTPCYCQRNQVAPTYQNNTHQQNTLIPELWSLTAAQTESAQPSTHTSGQDSSVKLITLVIPNHPVLPKTLFISFFLILCPTMSSAFLLLRSGNHLKASITNLSSLAQGGLWSHQHLAHRVAKKPTATSTTPPSTSLLGPSPSSLQKRQQEKAA